MEFSDNTELFYCKVVVVVILFTISSHDNNNKICKLKYINIKSINCGTRLARCCLPTRPLHVHVNSTRVAVYLIHIHLYFLNACKVHAAYIQNN